MQNAMSALPPKADMCSALGDVRFVPIADIALIRSPRQRGSAEPWRGGDVDRWRRRWRQKARRSSRSLTSTSVSGAVLVNIPTLGRWQLAQTTTVSIACTTSVYALLFRCLNGRKVARGEIGVARIECSNTRRQKHCEEEGDDGKRPLAAFHGLAP